MPTPPFYPKLPSPKHARFNIAKKLRTMYSVWTQTPLKTFRETMTSHVSGVHSTRRLSTKIETGGK
jgi:hypothetical protein